MRIRILILMAALAAAFVLFLLSPRTRSADTIHVVIPSGSSASTIGGILQRAGIVRWGPAFWWYATLTGNATALKAGEYVLCPCASVPALVRSIAGDEALSTDIVVTIPEGMNIWEVAATLQTAGLLKDPAAFARAYLNREGTLFPETYRFAPDTTPAGLIARMADTFTEHAEKITPEQRIVASILEKEAKTSNDMALIAGIIQRRRELDMPLQIDATVAYGACVREFQMQSSNKLCDVTQVGVAEELKRDGPYNTYTRKGLSAGAISNPGDNALWAAAHPRASIYLYYLSTRDGSKIIYAKTLAEHLKNRSKYLGL